MSVKIIKTLHVGISVGNLRSAIEWYDKNLSFKLVTDIAYVPTLAAKICFLEHEGFRLELFEYDESVQLPKERLTPNEDLKTIGTKHVAFEVEDYERTRKELIDNGVEIVLETKMKGNDVMFVHDNSNVLIELIHPN
jgi:methylmalonyl-CoA/ethylmalonyl-CoA epimerase